MARRPPQAHYTQEVYKALDEQQVRRYNGKWKRTRITRHGSGEGRTGVKDYRPTASDNLFTAYMDYLRSMDSSRPAEPALTVRADLSKAIEAACMEYFKTEKGTE